MKTKQEIEAYITKSQKDASEFEKRAWLLLAMWNNAHNQETFIMMIVAYWLDAKQELAKAPDAFYESHLRDDKVYSNILIWMEVDLTDVAGKGEHT